MDERIKWIETRINHSFKPKNEDLRQMTANDENRLALYEFLNNEDIKRLYIFRKAGQFHLSVTAPTEIEEKGIFFLKSHEGKITKENIDNQVSYFETTGVVFDHVDLMLREVYLPLLCGAMTSTPAPETPRAESGGAVSTAALPSPHGVNVDKLMDLLHRIMAAVQVANGLSEGRVVLAMPSIEVLAEAAVAPSRRPAVLHVLETCVVNWMKQIRIVLKFDPITGIRQRFGSEPEPRHEILVWKDHLQTLESIEMQLESLVAQDILMNLKEANSQYFHSFHNILKEIDKEKQNTSELLKFLMPIEAWLDKLDQCSTANEIVRLFSPLLHLVLLLWENSKYYHRNNQLNNFLGLMANEVVHRALSIVGDDVLHEPLESYTKLKDALRICASFRGTYLDTRDKADAINTRNVDNNAERMKHLPRGDLWTTKLYGQHAYKPVYGLSREAIMNNPEYAIDELCLDSPWPPRNAPSFSLLNAFMERCNDCLELVQTTQHFRLLSDAAQIGGAGSRSLDALVREIHEKYTSTMDEFFKQVDNVLDLKNSQNFERAFYKFRTVVKELERALGTILRQSLHQCPTILAQLRLLEVFEGISGRELVHSILKDKDEFIVLSFTEELRSVRELFESQRHNPPVLLNMPPLVCCLYWLYALKNRITRPMEKIKYIAPHLLSGELGWQMRDAYAEALKEIIDFEKEQIENWINTMPDNLMESLKQPLLVLDDPEDVKQGPPQVLVNLDPRLVLLLKEIHYLVQEPFNIELPKSARKLIRTTDLAQLRLVTTRLETIAANYNHALRSMSGFEKPLLDRQLAQIEQLLNQGLHVYTWKLDESADFIERASVLVNTELAVALEALQSHCSEITEIAAGWSQGSLDVFMECNKSRSFSISELQEIHKDLTEKFEMEVVPAGKRIHHLLDATLKVVQISQASPAWEDYVDYIDAIVLDGLLHSARVSLRSMLNHIVKSNLADQGEYVPLLIVRLELLGNCTVFRPPLEDATNEMSVQELMQSWMGSYMNRANLVEMLGKKGSYRDYLAIDEEIVEMVRQVTEIVQANANECKNIIDIFKDYSFLWLQDVNISFFEFLNGKITPNPLRTSSRTNYKNLEMFTSRATSRASSGLSKLTVEEEETAERTFLTPKSMDKMTTNVPSLDEFNAEIDIYRTARDELLSLPTVQDVGWLRVDLQPIRQVLVTLASKWMWTFTKYLADQVTDMLEALDDFLKRIEPELESITGEERDTASFMKMMRLFNEVSAQQQEMEGKFSAMHRTVDLLDHYNQSLPVRTQRLFKAAPGRWNNLKTKVSLAKQRLGPRIQEEAENITRDLVEFNQRVIAIQTEQQRSEVYNRDCSMESARLILDNFSKRLALLENEAQDLVELQELLDTNVVDFTILPHCRSDIEGLKLTWETYRIISAEQTEWKRHRWQKMNIKYLEEATEKEMDRVNNLPNDVKDWDVYNGLVESIEMIQNCLPLIEDLANPAMRTRHWKQLVRVTGGAVQVDNDALKRMTLGELLALGLQSHVDDVRAIVHRAVKDLKIEQSLKTYEEVWLSKVFDLKTHSRSLFNVATNKVMEESSRENQPIEKTERSLSIRDAQSETGDSEHPSAMTHRSQTRSRISSQSINSRGRAPSVASLPLSLAGISNEEDMSSICLLINSDSIFAMLEAHQVALATMSSSSAAGSFMDEVNKWQKILQQIEAVLHLWLDVQKKWVELEEVYQTSEVSTVLAHDAHKFIVVNRDFRVLMKATEKNPNILQSCSRKKMTPMLERMNNVLERCRKSLLRYLDRRRSRFTRFHFLTDEEVLHIVGNSYDISNLNSYIRHLFENVGSIMYTEVDNEKYNYEMIGVRSLSGEPLVFRKPVPCEGPVEMWLSTLLMAIRNALQYQMALAVGVEQRTQPSPSSPPATPSKDGDRASGVGSSRRSGAGGKRRSASFAVRQSHTGLNKPSSRERAFDEPESETELLRTHPLSEVMTSSTEPETSTTGQWLLNHVGEILDLVCRIRFTSCVEDSLASGNPLAGLNKFIEENSKLISEASNLMRRFEAELYVHHKQKEEPEVTARPKTETDMSETISPSYQGPTKSPSGRGSMAEVQFDEEVENSAREETSENKDGGQVAGEAEESQAQENSSKLDEENAERQKESSQAEHQTTDTMTLSAPIFERKEEEIVEEKIDFSPIKKALLPGQLEKLATLISLFTAHRDIVLQIIEDVKSGKKPAEILQEDKWTNIVRYYLHERDMMVTLKCHDVEMSYGFEFCGSAKRNVSYGLGDWSTANVLNAVKNMRGSICFTEESLSCNSLVREASHLAGRACYIFDCSGVMNAGGLATILRGIATGGVWVCFSDMNRLNTDLQSVLTELSKTALEALRGAKSSANTSVIEEGGSLLVTLDPDVATPNNIPFLERPLQFVQWCGLPRKTLEQFRLVRVTRSDYHRLAESCFLAEGFSNEKELARQLITVLHTSSLLLGAILDSMVSIANTMITESCVRSLITYAGHLMRKKLSEAVLNEIEDRHTMEQDAMVQSLNDHYQPQLVSNQARIFRVLLHDHYSDSPLATSGVEAQLLSEEENASPRESFLEVDWRHMPSEASHESEMFRAASGLLSNSSILSRPTTKQGATEDLPYHEKVNVTVSRLKLVACPGFRNRIMQLDALIKSKSALAVLGPAGCGKTETIKASAILQQLSGAAVKIHSIFPGAVSVNDFLGQFDSDTKIWNDGLLSRTLRKMCLDDGPNRINMLIMDGQGITPHMEMIHTLMAATSTIKLTGGDSIILPAGFRLVWELETLSDINPGLLSRLSVLIMTKDDIGWRVLLHDWLRKRTVEEREMLMPLFDDYLPKLIDYITECTRPEISGPRKKNYPQLRRLIPQTLDSAVLTFTSLLEALLSNTHMQELASADFELLMTYACLWGFGANLEHESRLVLADWWRTTFEPQINYPVEGSLFDYYVDTDRLEYLPWSEMLPTFSATAESGIPQDSFVQTSSTQALAYNLSLLSEMSLPVLLAGPRGCGKTSIVQDRIRTVCSGEVAEVLNISIHANRFTTSRLVSQRLDERMEWKYGQHYVPRGNKRLMCFVDDINLCSIDLDSRKQTAVELIRQTIDDGGHYYGNDGLNWRYVNNVQFVATTNPDNTSCPALSTRLTRHFCVLAVPYPSQADQEAIFTTLLQGHFLQSHEPSASQAQSDERRAQIERDTSLRHLLLEVVRTTIGLQDRLTRMFLPIARRCHYIFSLRTLSVIFRNLCHTLPLNPSHSNLLQLWRNECDWIYGERMIDIVDQDRYRRTFITCVKREFADHYLEVLLDPNPPLFTNIALQDSGLVSAGPTHSARDLYAAWGDGYQASTEVDRLRQLVIEAIDEYNKINPRIRVPLYTRALSEISRLARILATPHNIGHACLLTEGNSGTAYLLARLAAHLNGFIVRMITPNPADLNPGDKLRLFKQDLINAYTQAGVKSEKALFILKDYELIEDDFFVYLTEFIVHGTISSMFTAEEQTQIINSIRTEVTQAGLAYTREVAWDFFLKNVKENFHFCLIITRTGETLQHYCRSYPTLINNINFIWFQHHTKQLLVEHAMFHLQSLTWMTYVQRENIAHLLASMHLSIRQQDGGGLNQGEFKHINNTTYQKFIEKFHAMAAARHAEIHADHEKARRALQHIQQEGRLARRLRKQLAHEKVVLGERRNGACRILTQIGQDTAITESQMKIVKQQIDKIKRLKKLLPEYQVAHERAVYKAIATVNSTKRIIQKMDLDSLSELRSTFKPSIEVEDLMAAIIMILKSPTADLTWQKGGKRQMANIERFIEELVCFDEQQLPEETLQLVEPYLKKPSFDAETMEKKTNLSACGTLCRWVHGVARYHRLMHSRVRPLHKKVEETAKEVEEAEHRMRTLEIKRRGLETRLAELAHSFEEATIDKNNQEEKTQKMDKMLDTAARLRKIMAGEYRKFQQAFAAIEERESCIAGCVAIASGFVTYLGPYHYAFRRMMMSYHWPKCLRERGIPLVVDCIDPNRGRVVQWSLFPYDLPGLATQGETESEPFSQANGVLVEEAEMDRPDRQISPDQNPVKTSNVVEASLNEDEQEKYYQQVNNIEPDPEDGEAEKAEVKDDESDADESEFDIPLLDADEYSNYIHAIMTVITTDESLQDWTLRDFSSRQMENAAIIEASINRPPLIIDPNGVGVISLQWAMSRACQKPLIEVNMAYRSNDILLSLSKEEKFHIRTRSDPQVLTTIENAIINGSPILMTNCGNNLDNMMEPLIHHVNMANDSEEEARMIRFGVRRILCQPDFKPFFSTRLAKVDYTADLASQLTLVNYSVSHEGLVEELSNRAFAKLRPEVYKERRSAIEAVQLWRKTLSQLSHTIRNQLTDSMDSKQMWSEASMESIGQTVAQLEEVATMLHNTEQLLDELTSLRDEFMPLANHAASVYSTMKSLTSLHREYSFTMSYFLELFDEAIGGELPPDFIRPRESPLKRVLIRTKSEVEEPQASQQKDEENEEQEEKKEEKEPDPDEPSIVQGEERPNLRRAQSWQEDFEELRMSVHDDDGLYALIGDAEFIRTVLSARDADERMKVMEEITGRKSYGREPATQLLGAYLANRGTLRPRPTTRQQAASSLSKHIEAKSSPTAAKSEPEIAKKVVFTLPEAPELPTPGLKYQSLSANQIKQLTENLTMLVFERVKISLLAEDILLFAFMLCINTSLEPSQLVSEEEINLFIQGTPNVDVPLTLKDFESDASPPSWIPEHVWRDVMALSVLPGPLEWLCARVAENPDVWKEWYEHEKPEETPIPLTLSPEEEELRPLTDFHEAMVLRVLRPDRLIIALKRLVEKFFPTLTDQAVLRYSNLQQYLASEFNTALILLPTKAWKEKYHHSAFFPHQNPVDILNSIAKSKHIPCEILVFNSSAVETLQSALDAAERNNGWLILEDLHLADEAALQILQQHLHMIHKTSDIQNQSEASPNGHPPTLAGETVASENANENTQARKTSNFCVWMTLVPGETNNVPEEMLQQSYICSWDAITHEMMEQSGEPVEDITSVESVLKAMNAAFGILPPEVVEQMVERAPSKIVKTHFFALCFFNAVLMLRQTYGSRAVSHWRIFSSETMMEALNALIVAPPPEELSYRLWTTVYDKLFCNEVDRVYARTILNAIFNSAPSGLSEIVIGNVKVTTPPPNIDVSSYTSWFQSKQGEFDISLQNLISLESDIITVAEKLRATCMVSALCNMYEAQAMDTTDASPLSNLSTLKLRTVLDFCSERLPPLITTDVEKLDSQYNFPYHCPSALSTVTNTHAIRDNLIPETLAFVIDQECAVFNRHMCAVRQLTDGLYKYILSGPQSIPEYLVGPALALEKEQVPIEWQHPTEQPCTHNLTSWVKRQCDRYHQLRRWVKEGIIPLRAAPRGSLKSVWLGGLYHPKSFLTVLKHEKAMADGISIDEVTYAVEPTISFEKIPENVGDDGAVCLVNNYSMGAIQDENRLLQPSQTKTLCPYPTFILRVVAKQEVKNAESIYNCPVYINTARSSFVDMFPIPTTNDSVSELILRGATLILDPGSNEAEPLKTRIPIVTQPTITPRIFLGTVGDGPQGRTQLSALPEEEEEDEEEEEGATVPATSEQQSQLSYRPYSPKADPLPLGLMMQREEPLQREEGASQKKSSKESLSSRKRGSVRGSKEALSEHIRSRSTIYSSKESLTARSKPPSDRERSLSKETLQTSQQSLLAAAAAAKASMESSDEQPSGRSEERDEEKTVLGRVYGDSSSEFDTDTGDESESDREPGTERKPYTPEHSTIYETEEKSSPVKMMLEESPHTASQHSVKPRFSAAIPESSDEDGHGAPSRSSAKDGEIKKSPSPVSLPREEAEAPQEGKIPSRRSSTLSQRSDGIVEKERPVMNKAAMDEEAERESLVSGGEKSERSVREQVPSPPVPTAALEAPAAAEDGFEPTSAQSSHSSLQDRIPSEQSVKDPSLQGSHPSVRESPQPSQMAKTPSQQSLRNNSPEPVAKEPSQTSITGPSHQSEPPEIAKTPSQQSVRATPLPTAKTPSQQSLRATPPPVAKTPSQQSLRATPPPVAKTPSLQSVRATPPPVAKTPSQHSVRATPPLVAKTPSQQSLRATPPPVAKTPSQQSLRATPPLVAKTPSQQSLRATPPPVAKTPSQQSVRATPPPVAKTPSQHSVRATPPPVAKTPSQQSVRATPPPVARTPSLQSLRATPPPVAKTPSQQSLIKASSQQKIAESPYQQSLKRASPQPLAKTPSQQSLPRESPPPAKSPLDQNARESPKLTKDSQIDKADSRESLPRDNTGLESQPQPSGLQASVRDEQPLVNGSSPVPQPQTEDTHEDTSLPIASSPLKSEEPHRAGALSRTSTKEEFVSHRRLTEGLIEEEETKETPLPPRPVASTRAESRQDEPGAPFLEAREDTEPDNFY